MADTLDVERLRARINTLLQSWDRWERDCDDDAYHKFHHAMSNARDAFPALLAAAEECAELKRKLLVQEGATECVARQYRMRTEERDALRAARRGGALPYDADG